MRWDDRDIDRIVSKLIDKDENGLREEELPGGFRERELVYDVNSFNYNLSWQKKRWEKVLCVDMRQADSYPMLIAVNEIYEKKIFRSRFPFIGERYSYHSIEDVLYEMKMKVHETNPGTAKEYFRLNFTNFVRTRLLGVNNSQNTKNVNQNDMLPFIVNTQTGNLRILYSPTYLFGGGSVFGYPSTPVSNYIKPGSYIFGAEGIGVSPIWEATRIYHVPNDNEATLLTI